MRSTWVAALVAVVATSPAAAQVQGSFARVAETASGTMFHRLHPWPGINNSGLVAFQAMDSGSRDRYFVGRPGHTPTVIVDNFQSGSIYGNPFSIAVSDRGDVPFWRQIGLNPPVLGQYVAPAGVSITIAESPRFNLDSPHSITPNINSANQVVFFARTQTAGPGVHVATYANSTVSYTTIAEPEIVQPVGGPDLNAGGTAVFKATYATPQGQQASGLFVGGGGVPVTLIADNTGPIDEIGGWPVINDAGAVLYSASLDNGRTGIFRYANGTTTPVVEGPAGAYLFGPSLNNLGQMAFQARPAGGTTGDAILIGPNPATDTLIKAGDPLDGSTVLFLALSQTALNDAGQVVFTADLADGRRGIYVFTPVPEPGAVLAVAGLGLIAAAVRRPLASAVRDCC
jgi:hypothetical protein